MGPEFSHIKDDKVYMVDVTAKEDVSRTATARGRIYLKEETLRAIREGEAVKGNVLATARVAGVMAVKNTPSLIPMCHPLPVGGVEVDFVHGDGYIEATVTVRTYGKTGIEMEALTGVSVALLTKDEHGQYPSTRIDAIEVTEKRKGF